MRPDMDMESTSSGQHLDVGVASFNYVVVCHGRSEFGFSLDRVYVQTSGVSGYDHSYLKQLISVPHSSGNAPKDRVYPRYGGAP